MRVLYITYDGLLDPLGASQIIPYLSAIAIQQREVVVLSFEKGDRYDAFGADLTSQLKKMNISWHPLRFTKSKVALAKAWDLLKMYVWGYLLSIRYGIRIVHARGHAAAQVCLFIKCLTDAKLIFDFRGLWVDERVDKGGWSLDRMNHRLQFRFFKRMERTLLANADRLIVLTNAVVQEVRALGATPRTSINVIPCCADFEHFQLANASRRAMARDRLGIPNGATVLGYLGSIGRMYMLDRILRFFELASAKCENIHLLLVTKDVVILAEMIRECLPAELHRCVHICPADRDEVPLFIAAFDVLVCFIKPSYARMAASPTKVAECFSVGIPVICNDGVGDLSEQVRSLEAGLVIDPASDAQLKEVIASLEEVKNMGGERLRHVSREVFGIEVAHKHYREVYNGLN